ncbi:ABC transporter, ATP-binding protein, putative [Synechococcus sp. PCC 7335]|uniref:ABC transporter ATP-binding protein n=1 Tax=Synechococcus sp. (strain ATCC 29403 / PCC 7335) TaxID=91464 RepID=UPI00017EC71D|nr:ABC transporter ATP-binding protein [Synechococcus sp. PCC 7335]EDX87481.1 ABC transporter, ATP-binding protein, putative [Synechococcus sp. PCC 7335]
MSPLIQFRNIAKVYGTGNTEVRALWDVNMIIDGGEYCSIMGPSGSGKSTAMNMIGCLDQPTTGEYLFDGQDVAKLAENELAHIRNRKIGFVFQQFHLLPHLSALENVEQPMMYAGVSGKQRKQRAAEALERVGLENRMNNRPNQLSGGQQQRVAIARAIVNNPLLILADEPTGALDTQTTKDVIDIFSELNKSGITVVMVTHEPEVARFTNRIIWFRDGEVVNHHLDPAELATVTAMPV